MTRVPEDDPATDRSTGRPVGRRRRGAGRHDANRRARHHSDARARARGRDAGERGERKRARRHRRRAIVVMGLVEVTREVEATEKTKRRAMEEERRALAARMEYHARRATETARALAEAREALETSSRDARAERERADAATAACQSLRRELGRARKLNIDAERNARHELERGAKARKALVEMAHEARRETREAKTAVKETSERAQMLEEWAKRRDAAANAVATRLRRSLQDCAALARRVKVITEENVKLRRRAARDRADLFDANEYSERLEADWISPRREKSHLCRRERG